MCNDHNTTRQSFGEVYVPLGVYNTPKPRKVKFNFSKLSGDYKEFSAFIDLYDALLHNNSTITNVYKFNYLKISLDGASLSLIRHVEMTNDNYVTAYDTIVKRYSNKRLMANGIQ